MNNFPISYSSLRILHPDVNIKQTGNESGYRSCNVDCSLLFRGIRIESNQTLPHRNKIPDVKFQNMVSNCQSFKQDYITQPVSTEEANFPIAYSIVMYKDVEQFERLLRAIYRPQNLYCVHVDNKSDVRKIRDSVSAIANCFSNVFVAQNPINVGWCHRTVLEADLVCIAELLKSRKWKYLINLTGQEWPLKTNWELVKILKVFNGSNNIEGTAKQ